MITAPLPTNEAERLSALESYSIMDTGAEKSFDEIVELASSICGTPISLVTLLDERRQWFKAKYGLATPETNRDVAFCSHAILQNDIMVVGDAQKDERFYDNPLVTGDPDIRFYAGMPLIASGGHKMGTLCVIDREPRELTNAQLDSLKILSRQVVKQMELHKLNNELNRLVEVDNKLLSIIAHDLRSPLASISNVIDFAEKYNITGEKLKSMLPAMKSSVTTGLDLLSNLLDWAFTQFNGKNSIKEKLSLRDKAQEIINANGKFFTEKNNIITNEVDPDAIVVADRKKIEFVIRNLLLNANKFTTGGEINISTAINDQSVLVCIADTGKGITEQLMPELFSWENRKSTPGTNGEKGSGLGLPMCREFIESEGGSIWAKSQLGKGTRIYFNLAVTVPQMAASLS